MEGKNGGVKSKKSWEVEDLKEGAGFGKSHIPKNGRIGKGGGQGDSCILRNLDERPEVRHSYSILASSYERDNLGASNMAETGEETGSR